MQQSIVPKRILNFVEVQNKIIKSVQIQLNRIFKIQIHQKAENPTDLNPNPCYFCQSDCHMGWIKLTCSLKEWYDVCNAALKLTLST